MEIFRAFGFYLKPIFWIAFETLDKIAHSQTIDVKTTYTLLPIIWTHAIDVSRINIKLLHLGAINLIFSL